MRKRYSRSYTVLSFLTMFSYRELPFGHAAFAMLRARCFAAFASQDFYQQPKSAAAFRIRSAIGTPNGQRLSQA